MFFSVQGHVFQLSDVRNPPYSPDSQLVWIKWRCGPYRQVFIRHASDMQHTKRVRQGRITSPLLFDIYVEIIMRKALEDLSNGVSFVGVKMSNIQWYCSASGQSRRTWITSEVAWNRESQLWSRYQSRKNKSNDCRLWQQTRHNRNRTMSGSARVYLHGCSDNERRGVFTRNKWSVENWKGSMKSLEKTWQDSDIRINTKNTIV